MNTNSLLKYQYDNETEEPILYDENRFIIPNDMNQYFFGVYRSDYASLCVNLGSKSDTKYVFDIQILEEYSSSTFLASGTVEIYFRHNQIEKIIVNGYEDGPLTDLYNDNFDIYPHQYINILHK